MPIPENTIGSIPRHTVPLDPTTRGGDTAHGFDASGGPLEGSPSSRADLQGAGVHPRDPVRSAVDSLPGAWQLAERLREREHSLALLRATLDSTADGILVADPRGRVLFCNRQFREIWGFSARDVEACTHAELVARVSSLFVDPNGLAARIHAIYASGSSEAFDVLQLADGRVFERSSHVQEIDGRDVGRVWRYRDVTARERAEEALRDEARVLDMLNRTGTAIAATLDLRELLQIVTDAATALSGARFGAFFYNSTDANGDAYRLFALSGAPREAFEKLGRPRATPLFAPIFCGEKSIRLDDVLADPRYGQFAPHRGMPAGHPPVRSYLAAPVLLRGGQAIGGLFFGHPNAGVFTERSQRLVEGIAAHAAVALDNARLYDDMKRIAREREQLVEAERRARVEIARASRMKDEFLATLSHELRTPLTAILGWSKVLLAKRGDGDSLGRGLEAIARNAGAQAQLIDDLLDMSRIVSGKVRLEVQPVDLVQVVDAAIESVRPSVEARELRLRRIFDPLAGTVAGDPNRLQQVVWNLLANAVKFTPRGGKVDVIVERAGDHVEIIVADSGVGIEPAFLPQVFERFQQADSSTTRGYSGLGLGLAIVKHLVELHGGSVRAHSEGQGRGASFVVSLPPGASGERAGMRPLPRGRIEAQAFDAMPLDGLRVLVVDDEADARELIREVLVQCKAEVAVSDNATEALEIVRTLRPDVVISDIGMPERDGYELMRALRALGPEQGGRTPAIALTAFARPEDRTRAMLAGYHVHVPKPVDPQELTATVANLARRMLPQGD